MFNAIDTICYNNVCNTVIDYLANEVNMNWFELL